MATFSGEGWVVLGAETGQVQASPGPGIPAGTPALSAGTQRQIFAQSVSPNSPDNHSYLPGINVTANPSGIVQDPLTPSFMIAAYYKPYLNAIGGSGGGQFGWADAAIFNSMLMLGNFTDLSGQVGLPKTDRFFLSLKDNRNTVGYGYGNVIYGWSRCAGLNISQQAEGGPTLVRMGFESRWTTDVSKSSQSIPYGASLVDGGNTEVVYGTGAHAVTAPNADAGFEMGAHQVDFNGTLDKVRRWSLNIVRAQGREKNVDGTLWCKEINSMMLSGSLDITQGADCASRIDDTGQITIRLNPGKVNGAGVIINMLVQRDNAVYQRQASMGERSSRYSIIDVAAAGVPIQFLAAP